jgi:hypothetical protein
MVWRAAAAKEPGNPEIRSAGRDHFFGIAGLGQEVGGLGVDRQVADSPGGKELVMEVVKGSACGVPLAPVGMKGAEVSPESFVAAMRGETERVLREVMEAVNRAPDGSWINGSETPVRDLMGEYRRKVFERALQMRTDAAEGAFSPGRPDGPGDGGAAPVQGHGPA